MRPYDYFTVSHAPVGWPTKLLMTYYFTPTETNRTHFVLTFMGEIPYAPEWFKKWFCKLILKTQVLKLWKLESIDELIESSVVE